MRLFSLQNSPQTDSIAGPSGSSGGSAAVVILPLSSAVVTDHPADRRLRALLASLPAPAAQEGSGPETTSSSPLTAAISILENSAAPLTPEQRAKLEHGITQCESLRACLTTHFDGALGKDHKKQRQQLQGLSTNLPQSGVAREALAILLADHFDQLDGTKRDSIALLQEMLVNDRRLPISESAIMTATEALLERVGAARSDRTARAAVSLVNDLLQENRVSGDNRVLLVQHLIKSMSSLPAYAWIKARDVMEREWKKCSLFDQSKLAATLWPEIKKEENKHRGRQDLLASFALSWMIDIKLNSEDQQRGILPVIPALKEILVDIPSIRLKVLDSLESLLLKEVVDTRESGARAFGNFIARVKRECASEAKQDLQLDLIGLLDFIRQDAGARETCFAAAVEGMGGCGGRNTPTLTQMEIVLLSYRAVKERHPPKKLIETANGVLRYTLLLDYAHGRERFGGHGGGNTYTVAAYLNALSTDLRLPIRSGRLPLHGGLRWILPRERDEAKRWIHEEEQKQAISHLTTWPAWEKYHEEIFQQAEAEEMNLLVTILNLSIFKREDDEPSLRELLQSGERMPHYWKGLEEEAAKMAQEANADNPQTAGWAELPGLLVKLASGEMELDPEADTRQLTSVSELVKRRYKVFQTSSRESMTRHLVEKYTGKSVA